MQTDAWGMTKHASSCTDAVDEKVRDDELCLMLGSRPLAKSLPQQHSTQQLHPAETLPYYPSSDMCV